jgi:tetratricopeptide (TPR) repeat protein
MNSDLLVELTWAIEQDPSNAQAYFRRGNAYSNLGDYDRALEDLTRASEPICQRRQEGDHVSLPRHGYCGCVDSMDFH